MEHHQLNFYRGRRRVVRSDSAKGLGLFVVQPTPFCNLDCDYCYLPDRNRTTRLSVETLLAATNKLIASGLVQDTLSVVWHAGEPLTVPVEFYRRAFEALATLAAATKVTMRHSIQTNATLIDREWCELFIDHNVNVGVSVDGPAHVHDRHRKDRLGRGTHAAVLRGIQQLQSQAVPFHAICVVTAYSLEYADDIATFFLANRIRDVGFNIEELEGAHTRTTLDCAHQSEKMKRFWTTVYDLQREAGGAIRIREFEKAYHAIASWTEAGPSNDQTEPFRIVSMDCHGNVSTFSPELLGMSRQPFGSFTFGNLVTNDIDDILADGRLQEVSAAIKTGVDRCRQACAYYSLCGGGAPSNKLFEKGSFEATETMYCTSTIKAPLDIVLADLERSLTLQ
jgi:uncharacterized protein